jgi:hypothetical protein
MKIKNVKMARSIWLLDLPDLNPSGKDIDVEKLFRWIKDSYQFKVAPDVHTLLTAAKSNQANAGSQPLGAGAVFEYGHFQAPDKVLVEISKLTLYNDGLVIDTASSTMDGDQFAEHLLESAAREFSLTYDEETVRKHIYLSHLVVRSDISLGLISPHLAAFATRISEAFPEEPRPRFRIAGLQFWSEPNDAGSHKLFTLEPQVGKVFAERRYFSQAPLQTNEHFRLLQELEEIVGRL